MSKLPKLKWRVDPAPTGPYRSFSKRAWPSADYPNGATAGYIINVDKSHMRDFTAKKLTSI